MRRLFFDEEIRDTITIKGADAHHLGCVLRSKVDDECIVVGGDSKVAKMKITGFTSDSVTLQLEEFLNADTESPIEITLAMCLPKSDKMDFIVQKATELGISFIQPLKSTNSVVKYDDKKSKLRCEKWQKVANESAKQCGRTVIPTVFPITSLSEWLSSIKDDTELKKIMAYEAEDDCSFGDYLKEINGDRYVVLLGPEGGFTLAEVAVSKNAGFRSVTLGKRILKAETAAISAMTILQYEKGDLGNKK